MKFINVRNCEEKIYPGKLLCIGRNYAAHAHELGNEIPAFPIVFMKSPSVMIPSVAKIVHPDYSNDMHHEIELVLLVGAGMGTQFNLPWIASISIVLPARSVRPSHFGIAVRFDTCSAESALENTEACKEA